MALPGQLFLNMAPVPTDEGILLSLSLLSETATPATPRALTPASSAKLEVRVVVQQSGPSMTAHVEENSPQFAALFQGPVSVTRLLPFPPLRRSQLPFVLSLLMVLFDRTSYKCIRINTMIH